MFSLMAGKVNKTKAQVESRDLLFPDLESQDQMGTREVCTIRSEPVHPVSLQLRLLTLRWSRRTRADRISGVNDDH